MKHLFVLIFSLIAWSCHSKQLDASPDVKETTSQHDKKISYRALSVYKHKDAWVLLNDGRLMFTQNEGKSWEQIAKDMSNTFSLLTFINSENGWAVSYNQDILKTGDAGKSWAIIAKLTPNDQTDSFKQIVFCDDDIGYILKTSSILHTLDGGLNWSSSSLPAVEKDDFRWLHNISFPKPKLGWLTSSHGILKTLDGGTTWTLNRLIGDKELLQATDDTNWLDENLGWVIYDGLYKTSDGGKNWQDISPPDDMMARITSYSFIDKNHGWVTGEDVKIDQAGVLSSTDYANIIAYTSDGGKTYSKLPIPNSSRLNKIVFSDQKNGWLISNNYLYRSIDGGQSWNQSLQLVN